MFLSCHFSFPNDTKLNDMLFPNHYQYFSKEQITFLKYHVGVYGILEKHMCLKCTYQKRWLPFQLSVSLLYKVFNITLVFKLFKAWQYSHSHSRYTYWAVKSSYYHHSRWRTVARFLRFPVCVFVCTVSFSHWFNYFHFRNTLYRKKNQPV